MTSKELMTKSAEELERMAVELAHEMQQMRFGVATHQLTKVAGIAKARRTLARVRTILREKAHQAK